MNVSSSVSLDRANTSASRPASLLGTSGKAGATSFSVPGTTTHNSALDAKAPTSSAAQDVAAADKGGKGGGGGGGSSGGAISSALDDLIAANKRKVTPQVGAAHASEVVSSIDGSIDYQKLAKIVSEEKVSAQGDVPNFAQAPVVDILA